MEAEVCRNGIYCVRNVTLYAFFRGFSIASSVVIHYLRMDEKDRTEFDFGITGCTTDLKF